MKKLLAWLSVIGWMGFIFLMSGETGTESARQSGHIVEILLRFLPFIDESLLTLLVRKAAHMTEYAVLYLLSRNAFRLSGVKSCTGAALSLCFLYACSDEFHQRFIPGRGPSPVDVLIDTFGAVAASLLLRILHAFSRSEK